MEFIRRIVFKYNITSCSSAQQKQMLLMHDYDGNCIKRLLKHLGEVEF